MLRGFLFFFASVLETMVFTDFFMCRDEKQVSAMKLQHNKECKGLMLQIRYLKAKFVREACFRDGLVYQKKYLLELLGKYEKRYVPSSLFVVYAAVDTGIYPASGRSSLR